MKIVPVLRENIASEKADINRRNIEKYEASKQNTAKGQEGAYQAQQGRTNNSRQSKQAPKQTTSCPGGLTHTQEEWEELEEGGNPLRNEMGIKTYPQIKLNAGRRRERKGRILTAQ